MAKLSASIRKSMRPGQFGVPGKKALPMEDKTHAQKLFQLGPRAVKSGRITPGEFASAKAKAKAKFPDIKSEGSRPGKRMMRKGEK